MLVATDSCGVDTAYFDVQVVNDNYTISEDSTICLGDSLQLFASEDINTGGWKFYLKFGQC